MQQSPTLVFYMIVAAVFLFIIWLGYRLLSKWHPFYSKRSVKYVYWLVSLVAFSAIPLSRYIRPVEGNFGLLFYSITYGAYSWLTGLLVLLLVMFVLYMVRLIFHRATKKQQAELSETTQVEGSGISRRDFLQGVAIAAPLTSWAISTGGVVWGDQYMKTNRHSLAYNNLPDQLAGFKIAQLSDTHIGPFFGIDKLDAVLATIAKEQPNMLVITGDMIDDLALLPATMERLNRFAPTLSHGVYYCWGNHEYFRDINRIREAWKTSPVTVLENANIQIADGERPFYLLGVDYPWTNKKEDQQAVRRRFVSSALSGVPDNAFCLLIAHHPDFLANSFEHNIELTLAGHTHGGQVALFGKSLLPIQYKYMRGFYSHNNSRGYVNVGAGHWMPFRLGCPKEVTFFTLNPSSEQLSVGMWPNR